MASPMLKVSAVALLLIVTASAVKSQTFDVTKYGAKADGQSNIAQALTSAWKKACASASPSKVYIPGGKYAMGAVTLGGPCKAPIELQVDGTLIAPSDYSGLGDAWVSINNLHGFTLSGKGTFDGNGENSWKYNQCSKTISCKMLPMNIRFNFLTNVMVTGITSLDSKDFHMNVLGCKNITFRHVNIVAPKQSANTDGIHVGRSSGIKIFDTKIATGDDCISVGDGTSNMNVTGVTCGPGHGISIGSLGKYPNEAPVSGIFVKDCNLSSTDNGVRLKTWPALYGGSASDIHFENIVMNNVAFPIIVDQEYCPWNQCNLKSPSKVKISNISFKKIRGTSATPEAIKIVCSSGIPCQGMVLGDINLSYKGNPGLAKSICKNVKPTISGQVVPAISSN